MKLTRFSIFPAVAVAAMALTAAPAAAQQRDRGDHSRSEGQAVRRGGDARAEAPRRSEAPRAEAPRRVESPRQVESPRVESRRGEAPRADANGRYNGNYSADRRYEGDRRSDGDRRYDRRAVPRGEVTPRVYGPGVYSPRVYSPRVYAPRYYGYRPYVFRPRTRLSLGIYLGYGVPYAYTYPYPVPVYGYGAPSAPVYITPGSTEYGGITLEVTPSDADVIVDGQYVGQVHDFDGLSAPLNLMAGRHRIELNAPGYAPLAFDVDVVPGQLVPYRGDMQVY